MGEGEMTKEELAREVERLRARLAALSAGGGGGSEVAYHDALTGLYNRNAFFTLTLQQFRVLVNVYLRGPVAIHDVADTGSPNQGARARHLQRRARGPRGRSSRCGRPPPPADCRLARGRVAAGRLRAAHRALRSATA